MDHRFSQQAAVKTHRHGLSGHVIGATDPGAVVCFTVYFVDDDVLRDIHQAPGEVTGICRSQGGIGQTLSGAMG